MREYGVIYSYVNVTILDGDSTGTASEEPDGYVVKSQKILDPFESNHSSVVELIGFLRCLI